jgi:hypothetical protein
MMMKEKKKMMKMMTMMLMEDEAIVTPIACSGSLPNLPLGDPRHSAALGPRSPDSQFGFCFLHLRRTWGQGEREDSERERSSYAKMQT